MAWQTSATHLFSSHTGSIVCPQQLSVHQAVAAVTGEPARHAQTKGGSYSQIDTSTYMIPVPLPENTSVLKCNVCLSEETQCTCTCLVKLATVFKA